MVKTLLSILKNITMSHTVIGIFTSSSHAQDAVEYLAANGFGRENIDIRTSQGAATGPAAGADYQVEDPIGDFFRGLFGHSVSEASRYTEAGRNGTIVTVHAEGRDEADAAARILDNYGAADLDEREDLDTAVQDDSRLRSRVIDRRLEDGMRLRQEAPGATAREIDRSASKTDVDAFNKGAL